MAAMRKVDVWILLVIVTFCSILHTGHTSIRWPTEEGLKHVHMNQEGRRERRAVPDKSWLEGDTSHRVVKRETDDLCIQQRATLTERRKNEQDFLIVRKLGNETKYNVALTWVGENKGTLLMVTTEELLSLALPSTVYQSKDDGATFQNITKRVNNAQIAKMNGLQKDPNDPLKVYLVAYSERSGETDLWITVDGGDSFKQVKLHFLIRKNIYFYPDKTHPGLLMVLDNSDLYLSEDGGFNWRLIKHDVERFRWGTGQNGNKTTIYATINNAKGGKHSKHLMKTTDLGTSWTVVLKDTYTFGSQGKFLYASIVLPNRPSERIMQVSTDEGATWNEVQLPSITEDRFYSILDMSEGMIFMHVDNPNDSGHGTLFTSDSSGIIYSQSLERHLFPNNLDVTDFYKVRSMRGVYITSQIEADNSIHSMITFDRGATWNPIRRPEGVMCKDEKKPCYLQIHNVYSRTRGIPGHPPISIENAVGLVIVHGHVADTLQTTNPDVFISSDGGYSWRKSLEGPHKIQIADHGGLLVAVPDVPMARVIKFSTDEGNCWHQFNFTDEDLDITGLLTEPGNKAMSVAVWGFGHEDHIWRSHVLNFSKIITQKCEKSDYMNWVAHGDNTDDPKFSGCLLGRKETFRRLKHDSLCSNTYDFVVVRSSEVCACRSEDYNCMYGYRRVRDGNGLEVCEEDPAFHGQTLDICKYGYEEEIITKGYRKVPGDKCVGGFVPAGNKLIDLHTKCQRSRELVMIELGKQTHHPGVNSAIWVSVILLVFLIALISVIYFVRKYNLLHKSSPSYAYSTLSQNEEGMEEALLSNAVYEESTDEITNLPESATRGPSYSTIASDPTPALTSDRQNTNSMSNTNNMSNNSMSTSPKDYHVQPHLKKYHDDSDVDMLE